MFGKSRSINTVYRLQDFNPGSFGKLSKKPFEEVDSGAGSFRHRTWSRLVMFALCFLPVIYPSLGFSAGMTQHQFMADIACDLVSTPELVHCLEENRDAYLVGAPFPDAGYAILNDPMSDDAHSTEFIDAFVSHIRATYDPPYTDQYRLISFLMGVASHVADDPPYHWYFIAASADEDFDGDYDLAHTWCDTGIEFLAIVDYNRWLDIPRFWLPLGDIAEAYSLMGSNYRKIDILLGNLIILVADYAERLIAPFVYFPVSEMMPWTASNYYTYPDGGLFNGGELSAEYYESVWENLMSDGGAPVPAHTLLRVSGEPRFRHSSTEHRQPLHDFSWRCLTEGIIEVDVTSGENGSVIFGQPRIVISEEFFSLVDSFFSDIAG